MIYRIAIITKPLLFLGIVAFLLVSFLSLTHFGMQMDAEMGMSDCPFMGEAAVCNMSALEHLAGWHDIFSNILTPEIVTLALTIIALAAVPYWSQFFSPPRYSPTALRLITSDNRTAIPNLLQILFSKGILNPKLF